MRLKRVELTGFKSFMDRTVIDFREGITTILGPNGCGKSNVVDAVRWVLGEQSAKQLRGEKMEDVIFKGTGKRKPLSMAEVSLFFDNDEGRLDVPYTEVSITRRVSRSGQSDYFLNKAPCRLKDIKDLFYDTGVGHNAYSVIEQEVVGQVLDPHEQKVRAILEEGSGIVRYKVKRKEALRKLDLTERDLLRVEDIIDEIGKQVRSLAYQVGKARRHQRLFNETRALEILRAHHRMKDIHEQLAALEDQAQKLRAQGSGDDAELARHRAQAEAMRPAIDQLEELRKQRSYELSQAEAKLASIEGELLVLREKIESGRRRQHEIGEEIERSRGRSTDIEAEQVEVSAERDRLGERLREQVARVDALQIAAREVAQKHEEARGQLTNAQQLSLGFLREEAEHKSTIAATQSRLNALVEQRQSIEESIRQGEEREARLTAGLAGAETVVARHANERAALEQAIEEARAEVERAEKSWQEEQKRRVAIADELARVESRLEMARRIAKEYEGYRAGAAALLKDGMGQGKVRGSLAEKLQVEPGYEAAFELLFGEDADAVLVDDVADACELAEQLAREDLGLATFLAGVALPEEPRFSPNGLPGRPASDLITVAGDAQRHATRWLSRVRVVDTAAEAAAAVVEHVGRGVSFLAKSGFYVRHDGLVRGGAGARRELSLFGRDHQVETLAREVQTRQARLQEAGEAEAQRARQVESARRRVEDQQKSLRELNETLQRAAEDVAARRSVLERERETRRTLVQQGGSTAAAIDALMREIDGLKVHLGRHGEDQEATRTRVETLSADVGQLEADRERAHAALSEARLQWTHDQGVHRELEGRHERLASMREELEDRLTRLQDERGTLEGGLAEWLRVQEEKQTSLGTLFGDRDERAESVRQVQEQIEQKRSEAEAVQEAIAAVVERQREKSDKLHEIDNELTRQRLTLQNIEDRIEEKFDTKVAAAYEALEPEHLPRELVREDDTVQLSQVDELLKVRREKLEKIGPVNFVALDEYEEKRTRLQFLEQQRDDLRTSKEDLLQAIDRINRTARQKFNETFEQVRHNFQEIFATLFEGGTADLEQVKTDDPLEGHVEIHARPAGKRVDSVALLSGGERALTAIAFLFSVYLIKPSPFCLLDEVDAPLDDINVGRFVRLLQRFQEQTQFIVITHNKLTMEAADHLYGVTMEESGVSRLVSVSFQELDAVDPLQALEAVARERSQAAARLSRLDEALGDAPSKGIAAAGAVGLEGEA